jgi:hypothetical protein
MPVNIKVGKVYDVKHSRKGCFRAKVLSFNEDSAELEIVSGTAEFLRGGNLGAGDTLTVRFYLCEFQES